MCHCKCSHCTVKTPRQHEGRLEHDIDLGDDIDLGVAQHAEECSPSRAVPDLPPKSALDVCIEHRSIQFSWHTLSRDWALAEKVYLSTEDCDRECFPG